MKRLILGVVLVAGSVLAAHADNDTYTNLRKVARGDDVTVERLLEDDRSLVDSRDVDGLSPLLSALYRGRSAIASAILRRRPRLTVFEAAAAGDLPRVRALVDREGSAANAVSPDGYSPLGLAAPVLTGLAPPAGAIFILRGGRGHG